jgi:DNA-binding CsgD family transcriptional regulator
MRERPPYVRQLAAELELLSFGSTTSWNPAGGSSIPDSRPPSGESKPPHEAMLADWDVHGDRVLEKWSDVLKQHKGGGRARPEGKSEREIVLLAGEGHSAEDVAMRFRLTATLVRRWRLEDERNVQTGRRVEVKGRTQQQVADELGVSQPTVHRMRKRAA